MTTAARVLMVVLVGGALLVAATVAAAAAAFYGAGSIAVEVHADHGDRYTVRVPAGIANLALNLIPDRVLDEALRQATDEVRPYLPAVRDAWTQLDKAGDFVLVEVTGDAHVLVRKRDDRLLISVQDHETQVEVAVPVRTVGKLIHRL